MIVAESEEIIQVILSFCMTLSQDNTVMYLRRMVNTISGTSALNLELSIRSAMIKEQYYKKEMLSPLRILTSK
jgi:hypothetical protein